MAVSAGFQTPPRRQATIGHDQLSAGAGHRHIDAAGVVAHEFALFIAGQSKRSLFLQQAVHTAQEDNGTFQTRGRV